MIAALLAVPITGALLALGWAAHRFSAWLAADLRRTYDRP